MKDSPDISIVVPCYNEEESLPLLWDELDKVKHKMPRLSFEWIMVDDGSEDDTLTLLRKRSSNDNNAYYISFSRNFGKEAAILAGLKKARGKYIAVIDADLQDPPDLLPKMYKIISEGDFDCAAARRVSRKGEPVLRSILAKFFYKIMSIISDTKLVDGVRDFRLMSRKMVDAILDITEYNRFSKGIFTWVGFKTYWFEYENVQRTTSHSKWSFFRLFTYSVEGILAFSTLPLVFSSILGLLFFAVALVMISVVVFKTLVWGDPVAGYPSLMSTILLIGGLQLFATGILGQYLAKTYLETKKRPIFIVREESERNHFN